MNKYKTLFSNTAIFAISEFSSKFLVFIMLPLYTKAMSTSDFGEITLINSAVGLLLPVFTLSIANAALRFSMSKGSDNSEVFTIGLKIILIGFILLLCLIPVFLVIPEFKQHLFLFYLTYIASAIRNYFNQFSVGLNKITLVGISGVVGTLVAVACNVIFLIFLKKGAEGYLLSFVFSYIVGSIMLYFGGRLYKYLIFKNLPKLLIKEMLEYSLPYTPDSLSWWLNNASNRFIISFFWDISQVGLFSAAARVPTIIITFQNIFYNAWQLSAINEYSSDNKDIFYSKIYSFYNFFILFISVIMIAFVKIIASLLLSDNFFSAWIFIPYLFVSVIFGALAGFLGTLFAASKQTNHLFASTLVGGSISIFLNIILIPIYGPIAASVTNLVGYFIVWILRLFFSRKFIKFKIDHKKNFFCYLLIFIQATFVIYFIDLVSYIISVITILIIILLNKHEFIVFMGSIIRFISKKKLLNYDPLSRFN